MKKTVSIVFPAYNEQQILQDDMESFLVWAKKSVPELAEVLMVDDGSSDGTLELAQKLTQKYTFFRPLSIVHTGFGGALKKGVASAVGDVGILLNADWLDKDFVLDGLEAMAGADFVIGSKVLNAHTDHRPWVRRQASHLLTLVLRVCFGFGFSDSHGLKVFDLKKVQPIIAACTMNEIIESELLMAAQLKGLRIVEIPVAITETRSPRVGFTRRIFSMGHELVKLYVAKGKHAAR